MRQRDAGSSYPVAGLVDRATQIPTRRLGRRCPLEESAMSRKRFHLETVFSCAVELGTATANDVPLVAPARPAKRVRNSDAAEILEGDSPFDRLDPEECYRKDHLLTDIEDAASRL